MPTADADHTRTNAPKPLSDTIRSLQGKDLLTLRIGPSVVYQAMYCDLYMKTHKLQGEYPPVWVVKRKVVYSKRGQCQVILCHSKL